MNLRQIAVAVVVLSVWTPTEAAEEDGQVARELAQYYDSGKAPGWKGALGRLSSDDPGQSAQAASYLTDLLEQALKDELSGSAPWRATPYWGSFGENPARELRRSIAEALVRAKPASAAIPVYRWFLTRAKLASLQAEIMEGLLKLQGEQVDQLFEDLVSAGHPNAVVLKAALKAVGERGLTVDPEELATLCQHHRSDVREAARAVNAQRNLPGPPPFDPAGAMLTPPVQKIMEAISPMVLTSVPADAELVAFKVVTRYRDNAPQERNIRGWLLEETDQAWVVLTPHAWSETIQKDIRPSEEIPDYSQDTTMEKINIADEVERVAALRAPGDPEFELSEEGGLTGQFQGHAAKLYEILLGHWLYATGQYELAARILLPALDTLYTDEHLVDLARDRLGLINGYQMLCAFVGDRDYNRTLQLAATHIGRFDGTYFDGYAKRLQEEIPERRDDFKTLTLPTPEEWSQLRKQLTRQGQIRYLCDRMRLLNCYQQGQPGRIGYDDPQYSAPCGLSRDAAWGGAWGDKDKTAVINPYVQLFSGRSFWSKEEEKIEPGLEITVADIPTIAPYLKEDWFILAVSFWRDFFPGRTLERTRPLFCHVINEVAKRDLCNPKQLDQMMDDELDEHIKGVIQWAKENAAKSER